MLCSGNSTRLERGTVPVYLNVYDLTPLNGYAYWLGLGAYHSALQVHGVEYAFGAHEQPSTGIFEGEPKKSEGFTFRKSVLIGATDMGPEEVKRLMQELSEDYKGNSYNLITKNCNHFCNDASIRLTGNPIPRWVNRLAKIGFLCHCVLPASLNSTKVQHHGIEDKSEEGEQKKLTNVANVVRRSNSTPSSSSHPGDPTRGRTRTRTVTRRYRLASSP